MDDGRLAGWRMWDGWTNKYEMTLLTGASGRSVLGSSLEVVWAPILLVR